MPKDPSFFYGADALQQYSSNMSMDDISLSKASTSSRTFENFSGNISVKSEYNRRDYDYFRVNESIPNRIEDVIDLSVSIYDRNGIVKTIIDLMSDFASQGIRLHHQSPSINRFYNKWAEIVSLKERSERFVNILLKAGNVVVRRNTAKITKSVENKLKKINAAELDYKEHDVARREVPIRYNMLLPTSFDVVGKELSSFVNKPIYVLKIPPTYSTTLASLPSSYPEQYKYLVDQIPNDIREYIASGQRFIPIDQSTIDVYHYKKDDHEVWANPLIRPILSDLMQLEKYKLADLSALDGAISNIRLWNLGIIGDSIQNSLLPTKAAIDKLRSILANNVGGGVLDLVWGPELKFTESNSQVWRFLGSQKYEPVWAAIYDGMGVPPTLRSSGKGSSGTGNYVGLNTLIKRLQYVRDILTKFWRKELAIVHEAMGFSGQPPEIIYDFMVFADEAAERQLWINLYDRNIVSSETLQEIFGRYPAFEKARIMREFNKMENGTMPDKAGPYHNAEKDNELKKIALQSGMVTPSEVGIELDERKPGEVPAIDKQQEMANDTKLQKGIPGRPKNVVETSKRKPKPKEKASTKAAMFAWAMSAYDRISDILAPALLYAVGKESYRHVTVEESKSIELSKFRVLCEFAPFSEINKEKVYSILDQSNETYKEYMHTFNIAYEDFLNSNKKEPNLVELRAMYASVYSILNEEED